MQNKILKDSLIRGDPWVNLTLLILRICKGSLDGALHFSRCFENYENYISA